MMSQGGRVFVVMGAPASGKGTQCKLLAEKFGFVHLSTGDIFRDLCKQGTGLGEQFKEYMDRGCFVPDDVVLDFMRTRLEQPDVQERGCLLDGFPRTADQAQALLKDVKIDGVFMIQVPDKTLISRAAERRVDPVTDKIYHLKHIPPPAEVVDRLERRDRDDQLNFRQRIVVFKDHARRVLPHFSGHVRRIDGTLTPEEVFLNFSKCFESQPREEEGPAETVQQDQSCAICFSEPANFLVMPCGHQCGCEDCLQVVQQHSGRCPICRVQVEGIQRVFRCGRGEEEGSARLGMDSLGPAGHADLQDKLDGQVKDEDDWSDEEDGDKPQDDPVLLTIAPCQDIDGSESTADSTTEVDVMVSVRIPDETARLPADICCVVDVSGSMGSKATYEGEDGKVKDDGLTVLDIVKHAVKTVFKALQEGDRFSLVTFNQGARTELALTEMTEAGQSRALEALEGLQPGGGTNIWAGLVAAMDSLRTGVEADRQQAILLLTDGQPNSVPPRGHLPELRDYKDSHPGFNFQLNTFGFGYNLDSELLLDLAKEGQGTFAFIPDAIIVGTTFVNSVANVLSTMSLNSTLNLIPHGGAELAGPSLGGFAEFDESWGRGVHLGPLQHGQSRELVVPLRIPDTRQSSADEPYLEAILTYPKPHGGEGRTSVTATSRKANVDAHVARCLGTTVQRGYAAIDFAVKGDERQACAEVANAKLLTMAAQSRAPGGADARLTALLGDSDGRMAKATDGKERFNRWGKHYLRALVRSHQLQVCTNFMDPGLQLYGGSLFRELREKGDAVFLALPPPKPSAQRKSVQGPAPTMTTYYAGTGGGCFAPSSTVCRVTEQGIGAFDEEVPLEVVRAGDTLRVADGGAARVRCVARIARPPGKRLVSLPGGLRITPGHPVLVDGVWLRARDAPDAQKELFDTPYVHNVVLDRCHVLLVDGVGCATWGHGLQGDVIGHPFFGGQQVVDDLARFEGWTEGSVCVERMMRDVGGNVVGFWGGFVDKAVKGAGEELPPCFDAAITLAGG